MYRGRPGVCLSDGGVAADPVRRLGRRLLQVAADTEYPAADGSLLDLLAGAAGPAASSSAAPAITAATTTTAASTTMLPSRVVMQTVWSPRSDAAADVGLLEPVPGLSDGPWPPPPPPLSPPSYISVPCCSGEHRGGWLC